MDLVIQQGINGLIYAAIYALVAVGITLVFGLTRLVNFAHGDIMTLAAYAGFVVDRSGGAWYSLAIVVAVIMGGLVCGLLERGLFRFTINRPINGFLISLGLVAIIENGLGAHYTFNPVTAQPGLSQNWAIGGVYISGQDAILVGASIIAFIFLYLFLGRTRVGTAIRAAGMDRETVTIMGVSPARLIFIAFVISGLLAGLAGGLVAGLYSLTPTIGYTYVLVAFAVAIVGGLGDVRGAVVAAGLAGAVATIMGALSLGAWIDAATFGVMLVVLLIRPKGLFRGAEHTFSAS